MRCRRLTTSLLTCACLLLTPFSATAAHRRTPSSKLRIFRYPVPTDLLHQGVPKDWTHETGFCRWDPGYTIEPDYILLMDAVGAPLVTTDPSTATAFFIPHLTTCYMQHCMFGKPEDRHPLVSLVDTGASGVAACTHTFEPYLAAIIDWVRSHSPEFDKSAGMNHVMAIGHETLAELIYTREPLKTLLRNVILLQVNAQLPVYATPYGAVTATFQPHKDVAVAPNIHAGPFATFDPAAKPPWHDRPHWLYFRGTIRPENRNYSQGVRQDVAALAASDPRMLVEEAGDIDTYVADFRNARFCLHPPGWVTWSGRLAHILYAGCVPLIINDGNIMPYEEWIDWRKLSVKLRHADVPSLPSILADLDARGPGLEAALAKARRHLVYNYPPVPGDAFMLAMQSVSRRVWPFCSAYEAY